MDICVNKLEYKGINVYYTEDILEWGREFYGMPDDAELVHKEELTGESMGFSSISENSMWFFVSPLFHGFHDLLFLIAHELGHLVEGGFKKNPPDKQRYAKKHEQKAEHYETFFIDVWNINNLICDDMIERKQEELRK